MRVRQPAVAGMFYPADPGRLRDTVQRLLAATDPPATTHVPKVLIAPHAGYIYSGPVAAQAYRRLVAQAARIRRVVLLGPAHYVPVAGLALPLAQAFATPLGEVELDAAAIAQIRDLPQIQESDAPHAPEHSLEVQLPFLQTVLGEFRIVPLLVGDAAPAQVAEVLAALWGGAETLILVSSDLSHYHGYARAQQLDGATSAAILALRPVLTGDQACGSGAINGLLQLARELQMRIDCLDLRNSGDTAGDRTQVVGYGAYALH